jgi:hypothetical protein
MPMRLPLANWSRLPLSALAAALLLHLNNLVFVAATSEPARDPRCPAWDRETSIGIALLVPMEGELAEARLDAALHRLRRARKNCRAGRLDLAHQDYAALQRAYPFPDQGPAAQQSEGDPSSSDARQ